FFIQIRGNQNRKRNRNQPQLRVLQKLVILRVLKRIPKPNVAGQCRYNTKRKRTAEDRQQPVKPSDDKQQHRKVDFRRNDPESQHRQQRHKRAGAFEWFREHEQMLPAQRFTGHHAKVRNQHYYQRPVALDKTSEQPRHRETNMQEQQRQHDFTSIDILHATSLGE